MGSGLSSFFTDLHGHRSSSEYKGLLNDLPEGCVALILKNLDPEEICGLARLNHVLHGASSADFVWESKLPSNYGLVVKNMLDEYPEKISKKEMYARLCRPNLLNGGSKIVWLDKKTGRMCLCVSFKELGITGIDDRRYWTHLATSESRFHRVAYLQQIWWLQVDGEVEFFFPPGNYSLFFRVQLGKFYRRLGRRICNAEHVHGWDIKPVRFQLWTSDGQYGVSQCFLSDIGMWTHQHVGDFSVDNGNISTKLKFSMTQIDCTHTKGGLCVDSVLVCPMSFNRD